VTGSVFGFDRQKGARPNVQRHALKADTTLPQRLDQRRREMQPRDFVFLPSIVTTLLAGRAVARFGTRPAIWGALAVAMIGLPLMLSSHLSEVLIGMVLVGVGTFFAQAAVTGFVGQAAQENRGVASGTYLACYFAGGLVGSAVLGQLFDRFGWTSCVVGIGIALTIGALLTVRLTLRR
jgi:predicted MFS family arabinose efflux permease